MHILFHVFSVYILNSSINILHHLIIFELQSKSTLSKCKALETLSLWNDKSVFRLYAWASHISPWVTVELSTSIAE